MEKLNLLSLSVSTGSYKDITENILELAQTRTSSYTCVANVHMLVEAYRDKEFADIVNNADIITPDGKPITWGLRLMHHHDQARVAGMDLLPSLLSGAVDKHVSVYFLGGTERMLERTRLFAEEKCPDLKIAGTFSPPFRTLTNTETEDIVQDINNSGAGLVLVAMGCPKQEKWMASMKGRVHASMVGIGGALPVMIGQQKRAPVWMQNAGLEWAYRLGQEPRRLFKRYAITNTIFIWLLARQYLALKFFLDHHEIEDYRGFN
jgi:N-acetylglucosaminyldiphosphoundecaprenol N-acetyl-beta-D-mannosaminyltransferase